MKIGSFGKVAASLAAVSLVATPAFAAVQTGRPSVHASSATLPGDIAQDRGWGRGGWSGGGWGGGWGGRRHHDGVDAGDVFAGILVLGTIAAVASAASKSSKEKREREEQDRRYRDDEWRSGNSSRYGNDPRRDEGPASYGRTALLDSAVDACIGEVERGTSRVDTVDAVNREGEGWRVEGRTRSGSLWNCSVDGSGRIKGFSAETVQPRN